MEKIYAILLIFALITIIPTADAQLSLGEKANQKSIEVEVSTSEVVNVKHVISSSNMPVTINLFNGVIEKSIIVTNEEDEEKEIGLFNDGLGNYSITIFPTKENSIIKYTLEDASTLYDNIWTVRIGYSETFAVIFTEEIDLFFLNNNLILLEDKKGISVNGGANLILQYYSNVPKITEEVNWEKEKFDVEIISNSQINKFEFEQTEKSISFEVNEKNKFVTISMKEELLGGPYVILLDNEKIKYNKIVTEQKDVLLSMKPQSSGEITIIGTTVIPEFSMFIPLIMGFLVVLTVPFMKKFSLH